MSVDNFLYTLITCICDILWSWFYASWQDKEINSIYSTWGNGVKVTMKLDDRLFCVVGDFPIFFRSGFWFLDFRGNWSGCNTIIWCNLYDYAFLKSIVSGQVKITYLIEFYLQNPILKSECTYVFQFLSYFYLGGNEIDPVRPTLPSQLK